MSFHDINLEDDQLLQEVNLMIWYITDTDSETIADKQRSALKSCRLINLENPEARREMSSSVEQDSAISHVDGHSELALDPLRQPSRKGQSELHQPLSTTRIALMM